MALRENQSNNDNAWVRLKLTQMPQDGVIVNPNLIPSLVHDDILQVRSIGSNESVCIQYKKNMSSDVVKSKDRSIMICSRVFQNRKNLFPQRGDVEVRRVDKSTLTPLDSIELTFKEYYVSRADMWQFRSCLIDSCVYVGKIENWLGVLCTVSDIWFGGEPVKLFKSYNLFLDMEWICIRRNSRCFSIIFFSSFGVYSVGPRNVGHW